MQVNSSTISLTVAHVDASADFFVEHLGYRQQMAAEGFASLSREDAAVDVVFLQQGIDVLPEDQRDQQASGLIVALAVADLDAELARLQREGVTITLPLQEEEWGRATLPDQGPQRSRRRASAVERRQRAGSVGRQRLTLRPSAEPHVASRFRRPGPC